MDHRAFPTEAVDVTDDVVKERPAQGSSSAWSGLVLRWRRSVARVTFGPLIVTLVVASLLGFMAGRTSSPGIATEAAHALDSSVMPLMLDADGIWTSASDDREPVSEALVALRRDGDPGLVEASLDEWLAAYDGVLLQLAGLDLPAVARPVQRQFITAVTLSRDAAEVLGHAATVEEPETRTDLLTEVGRLRQRSEQLTQAARASILDLDGQRADVSPLAPPSTFSEGRQR